MAIYLPILNVDYMKTDAYLNSSALFNIIYAWLAVTFIRFKYYYAWKLSSCSIDACGISYAGKQDPEQGPWSMIKTVDAWAVESTPHIR